jgi:hypothetical protein
MVFSMGYVRIPKILDAPFSMVPPAARPTLTYSKAAWIIINFTVMNKMEESIK